MTGHQMLIRGPAGAPFFSCWCLQREDGSFAPLDLPEGTTLTDSLAAFKAHEAEVSGS